MRRPWPTGGCRAKNKPTCRNKGCTKSFESIGVYLCLRSASLLSYGVICILFTHWWLHDFLISNTVGCRHRMKGAIQKLTTQDWDNELCKTLRAMTCIYKWGTKLRFSLFWDVTQSRCVVSYPNDVSGQPIGPIFKILLGLFDHWNWDWYVVPKRSVTNYQSGLLIIPEQRRLCTNWPKPEVEAQYCVE